MEENVKLTIKADSKKDLINALEKIKLDLEEGYISGIEILNEDTYNWELEQGE